MYRKRRLLLNAASFVPGVTEIPVIKRLMANRNIGTGGSISARYCYSVWLRHLVLAARSNQNTTPQSIAELGPGDSLGIGVAALLSGAGRYLAFDVVEHANSHTNEIVFEELIELFASRADIPDEQEFPGINPQLQDYRFPARVLDPQRLAACLEPGRLQRIRRSLRDCRAEGSLIQYRAPWFSEQVIERDSIDLVFSQAVLEHVDELSAVYRSMHAWLAPTGLMSHQVDLTSHGWANEWNGHWAHSDSMWKLIRGPDTWLINREPKSTHLRLLEESGFRLLSCDSFRQPNTLTKRSLAKRFRNLSEDDLTTSSFFFQAAKR